MVCYTSTMCSASTQKPDSTVDGLLLLLFVQYLHVPDLSLRAPCTPVISVLAALQSVAVFLLVWLVWRVKGRRQSVSVFWRLIENQPKPSAVCRENHKCIILRYIKVGSNMRAFISYRVLAKLCISVVAYKIIPEGNPWRSTRYKILFI